MNEKTVNVAVADLVGLGIEHWRLSSWLAARGGGDAQARYALRRIADFLARGGIEIRDLTGRPFDAGLAARVIEAIDDPELAEGTAIVAETVSPMVLFHGDVVKSADVVTRRGCKR